MSSMMFKTEFLCVKCKTKFSPEENIGRLLCKDIFYTDDLKTCFQIDADHQAYSGGSMPPSYSISRWEDFVWTMDNNLSIESSILKRSNFQPDKRSIIVKDEFDRMNIEFINFLEHNIIEESQKVELADDIESYDFDDFEKEIIDDISSGEMNSFDSDLSESNDEENDFFDDYAYSSHGIIKEVIICRFDWRKKFEILKKLRIENEKILQDTLLIENDGNFGHIPFRETLLYKKNKYIREQYHLWLHSPRKKY